MRPILNSQSPLIYYWLFIQLDEEPENVERRQSILDQINHLSPFHVEGRYLQVLPSTPQIMALNLGENEVYLRFAARIERLAQQVWELGRGSTQISFSLQDLERGSLSILYSLAEERENSLRVAEGVDELAQQDTRLASQIAEVSRESAEISLSLHDLERGSLAILHALAEERESSARVAEGVDELAQQDTRLVSQIAEVSRESAEISLSLHDLERGSRSHRLFLAQEEENIEREKAKLTQIRKSIEDMDGPLERIREMEQNTDDNWASAQATLTELHGGFVRFDNSLHILNANLSDVEKKIVVIRAHETDRKLATAEIRAFTDSYKQIVAEYCAEASEVITSMKNSTKRREIYLQKAEKDIEFIDKGADECLAQSAENEALLLRLQARVKELTNAQAEDRMTLRQRGIVLPEVGQEIEWDLPVDPELEECKAIMAEIHRIQAQDDATLERIEKSNARFEERRKTRRLKHENRLKEIHAAGLASLARIRAAEQQPFYLPLMVFLGKGKQKITRFLPPVAVLFSLGFSFKCLREKTPRKLLQFFSLFCVVSRVYQAYVQSRK